MMVCMIKWLQPSIIVLAFIGLIDSLYLSYARFASVDLPCSVTNGGCSVVAESPYAVLFGMPLAYLGVLFYLSILIISLLIIFKSKIKHLSDALLIITVLGALSSAYFLYLQGFVIKAFCIYCIVSAIISFILLAATYLLDKLNNKNKL